MLVTSEDTHVGASTSARPVERAAWPRGRTGGAAGWGRHWHPEGEAHASSTRSPGERLVVEQGGGRLGGETPPGSCHWKPLFLAAPGQRGSASAGSDYLTQAPERAAVAPLLHRASPAGEADVTPLPRYLGWAVPRGGCADRDSTPHPAHSPACRGLSSSARLLGHPQAQPSSLALSRQLSTPRRNPLSLSPLPWNPDRFLCVQSVW